jgi:cysteine dioxygenase
MAPTLERLFEYLDTLDERAPLPALTEVLEHCAVSPADLAEFVRFSHRTYQRIPLRGTDWYQAWVMCWRNGQRSPVHDHLGSSCAVRVVRGVLTETRFTFAPNGHIKAVGSRDYEAGQVCGGEDGDVHQVAALQAGSADLVTLHVYSPPLIFMGTYDFTSAQRGQEPMMLEFCDAAGI